MLRLLGRGRRRLLVDCAGATTSDTAPSASTRWSLTVYRTPSHQTASNLIIDTDGALRFSLSADQRLCESHRARCDPGLELRAAACG